MRTQELLSYLLIVGAFIAAGWLVMSSGGSKENSEDAGHEPGWEKLPNVFRFSWGFVAFFEDSIGALLANIMPARANRFSDLAVISALPLTGERVLAASFAFGLCGIFAGAIAGAAVYVAEPAVAAWLAPVLCLAFFAMGWFWPTQNLAHYAELRQERITRELPFAIDLISGAMRSGLDFGAAMRYYVSLKSGGPLEEEFGRVLSDVTLGRPFADALNDMAKRIQLKAFTAFVGVVSYGMEIGAPIAQTLKMHGADLRRERFNLAERKAARVPAVMILPLVVFIMPAVFIIVLTPLIMRLKGAM